MMTLEERVNSLERRARWKFKAGDRIWQASIVRGPDGGWEGDDRALFMCAQAAQMERDVAFLRGAGGYE